MPSFPVGSIVDNIVLLGLGEINNSLRRTITIVKARGCAHEFGTREFVIEQGGIRLLPTSGRAENAGPLTDYSSLLGRGPTRFPRGPRLPANSAR
jgi:KaiC/GvpD/RAD55 family RecA-like ATPase